MLFYLTTFELQLIAEVREIRIDAGFNRDEVLFVGSRVRAAYGEQMRYQLRMPKADSINNGAAL